MKKLLAQAKNEEVLYWINHNFKNYEERLKKEGKQSNISEVEHIIDYLNSEHAPNHLRKMSYDEAKSNSERWMKTLIKQGMDLEEVRDVDFDVEIDFNDGFKLIKLKSELAYKREGSLMGHCVGSYFTSSDSSIYSLRDSRNMPHCTIEITSNGENVQQVKGKGNGSIHVKYVRYIIESLKYFKIPVRDSEMDNLGYFNLDATGASKEQKDWFDSVFTYETISFNKKPFIYKNSIKRK